ncbi:MAG TPA: TniQ family protein [Rhizobium sp.]
MNAAFAAECARSAKQTMTVKVLTWPREAAGGFATPSTRSFPISVQPGQDETAASLLGRAARANGYHRLQDACADQQILFRELANGRDPEVRSVAHLTGADPESLLFNTPSLTEPGWFVLGRERIKFSAFQRMGGQICPVCLQEDRVIDGDAGLFQRGIWQVGSIRSCHRHGVTLERNKLGCTTREAHDIIRHLRAWRPSLPIPISENAQMLEAHLLDRISKGRREDWVDRFEFHVVALFCEALGTLVRFGSNARTHDLSAQNLIEAGAVGFSIFREGYAEIISCLKGLQETATAADNADYGKLYTPLLACLRERRKDTAFDDLRSLVREFILDNFHVPVGTSVLGELSDTPRVVTVGVAAKQEGLPISILNRQLKMVDAIHGKSSRNTISDRATLISKAVMDSAVAEVRKLSSLAVTRAAIGADRYTMERLCEEGLIRLHFQNSDGEMPLIHENAVVEFIDRLLAITECGITTNPNHAPLIEAAARCHCTVSTLLIRALHGEFSLTSPLDAPFRLPDFYVNLVF